MKAQMRSGCMESSSWGIHDILCGTSTCSYADAEELGTQLYAAATGALRTALQDGSFISAVKADLSTVAGIHDILDAAPVSVSFEDVIIPIIQRFPSSSPSSMPSCTPSVSPTESPSMDDYGVKLFYPNWDFGDQGCRKSAMIS